jgi:hypothetical protein
MLNMAVQGKDRVPSNSQPSTRTLGSIHIRFDSERRLANGGLIFLRGEHDMREFIYRTQCFVLRP